MTKRIFFGGILFCFILFLLYKVWLALIYSSYQKRASFIIEKINQYDANHAQKPNTLLDVLNGELNSDALKHESFCNYEEMKGLVGKGYCFYDRYIDDSYVIYIGSNRWGWLHYNSRNKKWAKADTLLD